MPGEVIRAWGLGQIGAGSGVFVGVGRGVGDRGGFVGVAGEAEGVGVRVGVGGIGVGVDVGKMKTIWASLTSGGSSKCGVRIAVMKNTKPISAAKPRAMKSAR